jgi:hypothetical protein
MRAALMRLRLAGTLCALCMVVPALAGIDVSLERELETLQAVEALIRDIERAQSEEEVQALRARWSELLRDLTDLGRAPPDVQEKEIRSLSRAIAELGSDVQRFRDEVLAHFPKAAHRVAVFTFDDPDGLGIGDALSFLLAKDMLFSAPVRSFAVVNFHQGAAPEQPGSLGYFDKVEQLTREQGYALALWGRVRGGEAAGIQVETLGQAFVAAERLRHTLRLPRAAGGATLVADLGVDRFRLQSLALPGAYVTRLQQIVEQVRTLREAPSTTAPRTGELSEDRPYFIAESRGDWVKLQIRDGPAGWTSVRRFCTEDCTRLLDAASFANQIVAAGAGLAPRAPPVSLDDDARRVHRQLLAVQALAANPDAALALLADAGAAARGAGNLRTVARCAIALSERAQPGLDYEERRLTPAQLASWTRDLEAALAVNPNEASALQNLEIFYAIAGKHARAAQTAFLRAPKTALVIGNERYLHAAALTGAQAAATRVGQSLAGGGYDVRRIDDGDRAALLAAVRSLGHPGGTIVVFFSGHVGSAGQDLYLLPVDGDPRDPERSGISLRQVADAVLAPGSVRIVLLIDGPLPGEELHAPLARVAEAAGGRLDIIAAGTLARSNEQVGGSAFAFLLSEGLRGAADLDRDAFIDAVELGRYVTEQAERYALADATSVTFDAPAEQPSIIAAARERAH